MLYDKLRRRMGQLMSPDEFLDSVTEVNGVDMKVRDIPDRDLRAMMGAGHSNSDLRLRERHPGFETSPEDCLSTTQTGTWINDGQNLVCSTCGLDYT